MIINESKRLNESNKGVQVYGGDHTNFELIYCGPSYDVTLDEIKNYAKSHGYTYMCWGSDEGYGYKGFYNGDSYMIYKDANKLPKGYKEDALKGGKPV